jgi:hypothetical protein
VEGNLPKKIHKMQIHVWEGTVFICFLKMMTMKRLATLLLSLLLLAE